MPSTSTRSGVLLCIALCAVTAAPRAHAQATSPTDPAERIPIQIGWDQKIAMRDGVRLSAVIYRDPKQTKPVPAIVTMTPYMAEGATNLGLYFAQHGYVFIAVDARGRGNSEGAFLPGRVEAQDGYDVIEWAARQPWCDGQVATRGGSWGGFTQWSIAKEFPPHLKTMVPTASVHPGVDYPQRSGIFGAYMLRWLTYVHGRTPNNGLFDADKLWRNASWQQVSSGKAFQDLEDIVGIKGTVFRTWLAHPREDAYWQAITPRPEHYAKFQIPILTITGHYDDDQLGALTYYDRHMTYGAKDAIARHWLVIGPWDHSGTRTPKEMFGGLHFGPSSVMSMEELHVAWYDHVLKGGPVPAFLKDRVTCFIAGRNTWIHASDLKQIEGAARKLELDLAGAAAGDVTHSGRLLPQPPATRAQVTLTADPRYLPPGEDLDAEVPEYTDQRAAYSNLPSQIVWHSAAFGAETILAGRPRLQLELAVDQPDADLFARLYEVLPNGDAVRLTDAAVRLRYRGGGIAGAPMVPGRPEHVSFPAMDFFARAIGKGSRLRLVVNAGPRSLTVQRNTHTGGDLTSEPLAKARIARITVMTGPGSGSVLELPRPDETLLPRMTEPARR